MDGTPGRPRQAESPFSFEARSERVARRRQSPTQPVCPSCGDRVGIDEIDLIARRVTYGCTVCGVAWTTPFPAEDEAQLHAGHEGALDRMSHFDEADRRRVMVRLLCGLVALGEE
jgi:hypothetical protein